MTHLGVQEAVNDFSINHRAAANTGADRQVKDVRNAAPCTPAGFPGRGGVDVGVEADRYVERALHSSGEIEVLPFLLGRGSDVAEGGRFGVEIDRAESADADGAEIATLLRAEEFDDLPQGCVGSSGWDGG